MGAGPRVHLARTQIQENSSQERVARVVAANRARQVAVAVVHQDPDPDPVQAGPKAVAAVVVGAAAKAGHQEALTFYPDLVTSEELS